MDSQERLDQALSRLELVDLIAVATADERGRPWNSPVFAAFDSDLRFYWASHPGAQHSRNIGQSKRAFLVLYDSRAGQGGGLYLDCRAEVVERAAEIEAALAVLGQRRGRTFPLAKFLAERATQRVYRARPVRIWVNRATRDAEGDYIQDGRYEVPVPELVQALPRLHLTS